MPWLLTALLLTSFGYIAGRSRTPAPPPLTIIRRTDSPLSSPEDPGPVPAITSDKTSTSVLSEEEAYLCGAQTKKGTPCSRRVHGPVRCWQHKGTRAMMSQDKLRIKEQDPN